MEQQPLVSVIIPEVEDDTYLVRCINSIRQQTYENVEIILAGSDYPSKVERNCNIRIVSGVNRENTLNKAIDISNGKYILFCSVTSILSYVLIATLIEHAEKNAGCAYAFVRLPENENFSICRSTEISLWGKLFCKEKLLENNIHFSENFSFSTEEFVLRYLALFTKSYEADHAEIYETDTRIFDRYDKELISEEEIERVLLLFKNCILNSTADFICNLLKIIRPDASLESSFRYVVFIARNLNKEKELNYRMAEIYGRNYYTILKAKKDEEMFTNFKSYLRLFENEEEYLNVILKALMIGKEQYKLLTQYNLKDYLFYMDKVPNSADLLTYIEEVNNLKNLLDSERKRIDHLENIKLDLPGRAISSGDNKISSVNVNGREQLLSGPELADFVVNSYQKGNLGLKTILKSITAWIKYKL